LEALKLKLGSEQVGENIQRGKSICEMYKKLMLGHKTVSRRNIMSKRFNEFGIGTAKGKDGKLYMVQFFRHL
jgi:uncharacterized protein YkwD